MFRAETSLTDLQSRGRYECVSCEGKGTREEVRVWWGWDGGEVRKMRETKEVAVQDSCGGVRKGRRRGSAKETY